MTARLNKKNITGNLKGEGMVQGGVLVFDKQGELRYAYNEETGTELNMEDVQDAIDSVRKEQKSEL
jgi:sensor domain CHASE-containing protein